MEEIIHSSDRVVCAACDGDDCFIIFYYKWSDLPVITCMFFM